MKIRKKVNKKITLTFFIMIIISFVLFMCGMIFNLLANLNDFNIVGITENKKGLFLNTTKCYNAISYNAEIYDSYNNLIYETTKNTNSIDISSLILDNNEKITIKVYTKNIKGDVKYAENIYNYKNEEASFSELENRFVKNNENYELFFLGIENPKDYKVSIFYKEARIKDYYLSDNNIKIEYEDIKNYNGKLTIKLYNKYGRIISLYNIYINSITVGNFEIISPENNFTSIWDDLKIYYKGGNNANRLIIKIYNEKNQLINQIIQGFDSNMTTIDANNFKENTTYKIELSAVYNDYYEIAKTDTISINISTKQTVSPVYVDKNFTFIKPNTSVQLLSDTKGSTIYYTLDGSTPNENSFVYSEPLTISTNTTIKAMAKKKNMYDSDTNIYNFNIFDKQLVIYLSPSNQKLNYGVSSAGYTNESEMMNKLANYLENILKENGVTVYRNNPSTDINTWLAQSNRYKSDLHLAIHSNASQTTKAKGIEIYVDSSTSKCLSVATNIYNNLYEIYPYRDYITDRGVKYSSGSLGEANDKFISCGALIEVAYHDNYDDALWIVQNLEQIAGNMADSILKFYQYK